MRRSVHSLLVSLLAAAGLVVLAVMPAAAGPEGGARLTASPDGNPLGMSNSKNGVALLDAGGIVPGDPARSGTVTISNTGSADGDFSVAITGLQNTPGPFGGLLSSALDLRIDDVTAPASPVTLFRGKLGAMGAIALGEFRKRTGRTYRFTISLPDGGHPSSPSTGDNRFQGSAVRADFVWTETKANGNGPKDTEDKDKDKDKDKAGTQGATFAGESRSAGTAPAFATGANAGPGSPLNGGSAYPGGAVNGGSGDRSSPASAGSSARGKLVNGRGDGGGGLPFVGLGLGAFVLTGAVAGASGIALRRRLR